MYATILTIAVFFFTPLHIQNHMSYFSMMRKTPVVMVSYDRKRPKHHHKVKLPRDYGAWSKVADCEEGGWHNGGYTYPDSLGIDRTNYINYGGKPQTEYAYPTRKQKVEQIRVADKLIKDIGISIPDQDGCQPGGW